MLFRDNFPLKATIQSVREHGLSLAWRPNTPVSTLSIMAVSGGDAQESLREHMFAEAQII